MMKAGFIGCGNMGGVLAAAAARRTGEILAADHHPEKTARIPGAVPAMAEEIARRCKFIFLGVKPQGMAQAAAELRPALLERRDPFVLVSMAAGLSISSVWELFQLPSRPEGCPVIRVMPNTPAAVGEGVLLYCTGGGVTREEEDAFRNLMGDAGAVLPIPEAKIDAASALSGCGPAFVCLFLEGLIDGAVRCGLPRDLAERFALQTALGTAKLALETGQDPALLRAAVCSPGGSTIAGIAALEEHSVRFAAMESVRAAYERTLELGK